VTVVDLAIVYAMAGAAAAIAVIATRRPLLDGVLMLGLWPIYGPFLLLGGLAAADDRERELLEVLRRAAATPLGSVLPDEATARALARRLRDAAARVREIDGLLARPDFDERAARLRAAELERRGGSSSAASTAALRVQTIERMRHLRDRTSGELDEVGELIAQLMAQAELVRLSGAADGAAADLVRELVARVEGLDGLLAAE
jgi:hypothetical protein